MSFRSSRSAVAVLLIGTAIGAAQTEGDEDAAQQAVARRFIAVLEKNPRRGTAFDKVYEHFVERGQIEELLANYRQQGAAGGTGRAAAWMIVGLVEARQGREAAAVAAFKMAETLDPASPLAPYYLGLALIQSGDADAAAAAHERAAQRQPSASDLLEIYQSLGRIYQRSHQTEKALEVWNRLERAFPDDLRVREQIATTLLEEQDFAGALPRFESLARATRDAYRKSLFQVEAAEIKVRLGRTGEGLEDFESILTQLNPENWLFRDVRRRMEAVFLKENNQAGLVEYYQAWLKRHPEDLDAVGRLSRLLSGIGRGREAREWLERGLTQAPSNRELRLSLISVLRSGGNRADMIEQYRMLDKHDPDNPETLRDWGLAIVEDPSGASAETRRKASAVWRRLTAIRPTDALAAAQAADLHRRAGMPEEALELYRRAVDLAADSAQYREYLGEYLHSLKRTEDAVAAWREMAAGPRRTAPNLARLAEVFTRYDRLDDAIGACDEACRLDPKDLALQLKFVDLLSRVGRHDDALRQLSVAEPLAASDEEREACLQRELKELKQAGRLGSRIAEVQREVESQPAATQQAARRWYWLARAKSEAGQSRAAAEAIAKARELAPDSLPILVAAARIYEVQRQLRPALEIYTKLAAIDRRFRTEHLQRVARLEELLGHRDQALRAGRDVFVSAAGSPEASAFFAQLCFRLGEHEEGIRALRRAVRSNPGDVSTLMTLAVVLVERKRAPEAIELLWRAFDRSSNLDERLAIVQHLAEAAASVRQLNAVYIRLERQRRDPGRHRELTLCLARAHDAAGDLATAQRKLETLLTPHSGDIPLLTQLRTLAERQNDIDSAVRFQRQIWQATDLPEDRYRLAQLMLHGGQTEEALDLLTGDNGGRELTADALKLLDGLQRAGRQAEVLARLQRLRNQFPDNWELLYREGVALSKSDRQGALERFTALVKLDRPFDETSLVSNSPPAARWIPNTATPLPAVQRLVELPAIQQAIVRALYVRPATAVASQGQKQRTMAPPIWTPGDYGTARLAAWCWLVRLTPGSPADAFLAARFPELASPASRQNHIDRITVLAIRRQPAELYEAAWHWMLAHDDDIEAKVVFLQSLTDRNAPVVVTTTLSGGQEQRINKGAVLPPLSEERIDEAVAVYRQIAERPDLVPQNVILLNGLSRELKAAGREEVAMQLALAAARKTATLIEAALLLVQEQPEPRLEVVRELLDRLILMRDQLNPALPASNWATAAVAPARLPEFLLPLFEQDHRPEDLLGVWSRYLKLQAAASVPRELSSFVTRSPAAPLSRLTGSMVVSGTHIVSMPASSYRMDARADMPAFLYGPQARGLLDLLQRQFKSAQREGELVRQVQAEARRADTTPAERMYWNHALAWLYWKLDRRDEALGVLAETSRQMPSRQDLRLGLALQYEMANQPRQALDALEGLEVGADFRRDVDKIELRLALAAGQTDRAKAAASRLSQGDVPHAELLPLSEQLSRLGLFATAESLLQRMGDAAPAHPTRLQILMDVQLAQGKNDAAFETATALLALLDEGTARVSGPANPQVQAARGRSGDTLRAETRTELQLHCFKVLHATGQLAGMIEAAEKLLAAAPQSEPLINRLIAYHTAADNQPAVDQLIVRKLKLQADQPASRYALALKYLELDRPDEAREQMMVMLERDPVFFASRCRDSLFRLDGRKELPGFTRLLQQLDWGVTEKSLAVLPSVIEQLRARESTRGMAGPLFVRQWESRPDRRIDLLQRFPEDHWWNMYEVRRAMNTVVAPATGASGPGQWRIFGKVIRYEDRLVTVWNRLLTESASRKSLDNLAADIEQGIGRSPDWTAGRVLRAMVDLRQGRFEAGRAALEALFPTLEPVLQANPHMAWEIGQELVPDKSSLDAGAKYLAVAIRERGSTDWISSVTPGAALLKAYAAHGRQAEARQLLLVGVPASLSRTGDARAAPSATDFASLLAIGRALRSIDLPLDAIEVYLAALQRSEGMPVGGYDPRNEIQSSLVIAFGELKPKAFVESLEQFDAGQGPFRLYLFVRQSDPGRGRMQSRWGSILGDIAEDRELYGRASAAADRMAGSVKGLSPLVLSALLALAAKDRDRTAAAVARLDQFVDQHPLAGGAESAAGRPPEQAALWLVARECLVQPPLAELGEKLGQRARDACRQAGDTQFDTAIEQEWSGIAAVKNQAPGNDE